MKKYEGGLPPRKWWMGLLCLLMVFGLLATSQNTAIQATADETDTEEEAMAPFVSAYVFDRAGLVFRDEDGDYISQMNYSFALIEDGRVTAKHWRAINAFKKYIRRHSHIVPVMAIGGWGADGFSQAASTREGRAAFVESAIALMQEHGFLGIDIDWEYPGSSVAGIASRDDDSQNLLLLLQDLRTGMDALTAQDGKKRLLSIAVGGSGQYANMLDCIAMGEIVDQVNVMTYDLRGFEKVTGHHTPLYPQSGDAAAISGDGAMEAFARAGIPKEKLMLGAAFYGRAWRNVRSDENSGLGQAAATSGNKTYSYGDIEELLTSGGYTRYWDENAMAPYLFNGKTFISYEDPQSIAAKGSYARENGLMGVMFWEYGQDTTGSLVKALYGAMHTAE